LALASISVVCLAACGSGSPPDNPGGQSSATTIAPKPSSVIAGPAGLLAGVQPQPNGMMWLLAGNATEKTLQELNVTNGNIAMSVDESNTAVSVAQLSSGIVGVGLATATTGALELHNGSSGALLTSVPIGAPVKAVAPGFDGQTFYVLNGNATSSSVTLVNAQLAKTSISVPVPLDTISVAADPNGQQLYTLGSGGAIRSITVASGLISAKFGDLDTPVAMVISSSGTTLYVLKTVPGGANVAVIDLTTERQETALPAARDSVGLQLAPGNQSLYDIVGTPTFGNVQLFPLSP
jgi:hypothetical protein